jgi:hypothetical protein
VRRCEHCKRRIWPWQQTSPFEPPHHKLCITIWFRGWADHIAQLKKPVLGECNEKESES